MRLLGSYLTCPIKSNLWPVVPCTPNVENYLEKCFASRAVRGTSKWRVPRDQWRCASPPWDRCIVGSPKLRAATLRSSRSHSSPEQASGRKSVLLGPSIPSATLAVFSECFANDNLTIAVCSTDLSWRSTFCRLFLGHPPIFAHRMGTHLMRLAGELAESALRVAHWYIFALPLTTMASFLPIHWIGGPW